MASDDGEWVTASASSDARPGTENASVDSRMPAQIRAARQALGAIRLMATSKGAPRVYGSSPLAAARNDPALAAREVFLGTAVSALSRRQAGCGRCSSTGM